MERPTNRPEKSVLVEKVYSAGKTCLLPGMSFRCISPFANSDGTETEVFEFLGYSEIVPNELFVRIKNTCSLEIEIHISELGDLVDEDEKPATFGLITDWQRKVWGFESAEDGYINLSPPQGEMSRSQQRTLAAEVQDIINWNVGREYRSKLGKIDETQSLDGSASV